MPQIETKPKARQRRARRFPIWMQEMIFDIARTEDAAVKWSAEDIRKELEKEAIKRNELDQVPSIDTIQRVLREDVPEYQRKQKLKDAGRVWTFAEEENAQHARLVLDVLAYLNRDNQQPRRTISKGKARWIIKLRLAYPELANRLDLVDAYSTGYWIREIDGQNMTVDDVYIAQMSSNWSRKGENN